MKECQLCKNCFTDDVGTCPNDGMPTVHTIGGDPVLEGKYHLECRLGQGGMGVVYKARHAYLKTQLAIKIILPDLVGNDPQLVTRFRQEALAAAAIRHQNVVSVTDYGVIGGTVPFLVMEYVEGESLHDLLAREKSLKPERALELMSAICAGVGAAHHQGIVHRDLKPLNIMICKGLPNLSQSVKILDFGLAKIKSGELLGSFIQAQTTGLMGSPYYMAPEQWADEDPDSRADIYSLGVLLFQMLVGDVPFKGSSIPAIMKKHINDPPPTFAELGLQISPAIETAVRRTLHKEPQQRTSSVEALISELKAAITSSRPAQPQRQQAGSLPVSALNILTNPAGSKVYVDNVAVGQSRTDGWLLLEGIQSGNHHLRVSYEGFPDWQGDVMCDGKPRQVVADLRKGGRQTPPPEPPRTTTPPAKEMTQYAESIPQASISPTQHRTAADAQQTVQQSWQGVSQHVSVPSQPPPKRRIFSPLVFAIAGILGLLILGITGITAAFMMGWIGGISGNRNAINAITPTPTVSPKTTTRVDMVAIPAGSFRMGRGDGRENERPEHEITVGAFSMDRNEVTNAEYLEFVIEKDYRPTPANWEKDKPLAGEEKMPVRYVSVADAEAFAAWRSERDGVSYRLPTEQEWEYAARNGAKNDLYPWGDKFEVRCAVVDQTNTEPKEVGSSTCPNIWGVNDLIGNVYEWTGTKVYLYPGSRGTLRETGGVRHMIRGGAALNKSTGEFAITSTFRADIEAGKRDKELGFRLVKPQ